MTPRVVLALAAGLLAAPPSLAGQERREQATPRRLRAAAATGRRVPPTPRSVLGFEPGDDRKLADWPTLVRYYQALAKGSDRVRYHELGKSTLGAPYVALAISSARNLKRLDYYRRLNARLADPRSTKGNHDLAEALRHGRTVVLITAGIHSTEVGGHLTPAILAYRLASDTSAATRAILDAVILWLVPSLNPDGVTLVTRWYNRTLGTPPFNFMLHTAPLREGALDHFHWHLEIIPKLTRVAGYEWGSGFFINPAPPEDAAEALRDAPP